jgi:hypothetical protein
MAQVVAPDEEGGSVSGLESRLQAVEGVESIELELGESGLEGITVRLAPDADEGAVLDGVRRLLVAYGTKVPRQVPANGPPADEGHEGGGVAVQAPPRYGEEPPGEPDPEESEREGADPQDEAPSVTVYESTAENRNANGVALGTAPDGDLIHLEVGPGGDHSSALVAVSKSGRVVRRQIPASPKAIIQAVIDAGAELTGSDPISVIGMNVSSVGSMRILTVIVGNHGSSPKVCTASVVESDWPAALIDILGQVLQDR